MAEPDQTRPKVRTLIESAFPEDMPPAELSVAIVSLVELCQLAMPDPARLRQMIESAKFEEGPQQKADELGGYLALDNKVFSFPVRNLQHKLWARDRHGAPVLLLLSEGDSDKGRVVFMSAVFSGAQEGDAVKAVADVAKKQPLTGATLVNANGTHLRRVFWDVEGQAGIRGLMVTGPQDVDALRGARAFTAFNFAGAKTN